MLFKMVTLVNGSFHATHEMFQHLEDLQNSMIQYLPNDQYMVLQSQVWVKK